MKRDLQLLLLLLICYISFFWTSDMLPANIMEARNFVTAREMLFEGNWMFPTMNGVLRLEKPPLPTWITAFTMWLGGMDNISILRIPSALSAVLLVFFVYKFTGELTTDKITPFLAAVTTSTSFYIYYMARISTWDIYCHTFMIGALWLLFKGLVKKEESLKEFIFAGILFGLSFMSKGPVAFYALLVPFLIAFKVAFKTHKISRHWRSLLVLLVAFIIVGFWWPLYVYFTRPELSILIWAKESTAWISRNVKPFYYYLSFPMHTGIWVLFGTVALIFPYSKKRIDQFGNYNFLAVWLWACLIALSVFPEKKERYLLPLFIIYAIFTAFYFRYIIEAFKKGKEKGFDKIVLGINTLFFSSICVGVSFYLVFLKVRAKLEINTWLLGVMVVVFIALAVGIQVSYWRKKLLLNWGFLVGLNCSFLFFILPYGLQFANQNKQYFSLNNLRYDNRVEGMKFYCDPMVRKRIGLKWDTGQGLSPFHFQELMRQLSFCNLIADEKENPLDRKGIELYYLPYKSTDVKMQLVWEVGRPLILWHPELGNEPFNYTPFAFVSREHPKKVMPKSVWEDYEVEYLGVYDDNFIARHLSLGSRLRNHVAIIRKKNQAEKNY